MAATSQGTAQFFNRLKADGQTPQSTPLTSILGNTGLTVSRVGFGGYRLHEFEPDHREALVTALKLGCNLIDTSSNYTDGSSERLIGQVLREQIDNGTIKREEIVVVSKAGYLQGATLKDAKARQEGGRGFSQMVEYQSDCWHNISPEFLEEQITQSLERLHVDKIDVLLLHNPEYYLKSSGTRELYYQRLEKAFRHLESECFKGRIQYYGVSSNTLSEDEARSDFTSLAKLVEIAGQVSKESRFAVIQCPFNLFESGAALLKNNRQQTVLEVAAKANLGVLTNRPFNSHGRGKLIRLTSFPYRDEVEVKGGLHTALGRAIELEKLAPGYPKASPAFQWAHVLRERVGDLDDLLAWKDALYQQIYPSIRTAIERLSQDRQAWAEEYRGVMREFLGLITSDLENLAHQKSKMLEDQLIGLAPDLANGAAPSLSRKILRIYTAFPQVSSILVGMRTPAYVADAMASEPPLTEAAAVQTLMKFLRYRS